MKEAVHLYSQLHNRLHYKSDYDSHFSHTFIEETYAIV